MKNLNLTEGPNEPIKYLETCDQNTSTQPTSSSGFGKSKVCVSLLDEGSFNRLSKKVAKNNIVYKSDFVNNNIKPNKQIFQNMVESNTFSHLSEFMPITLKDTIEYYPCD
ncbi:hypothetical protein BpHYR1_040865 [Brachionus plicatilis]|uniref:Uncharacterized protein n=1 Tax=Brachionus plicatilis TaxID=10195 RepID=A0A3M7PKY1_BRAPC|nr:hypothetical protein BpHYR1_040865 [Brachionus plicatilis]